jgi:hypothetical protein
MVQNHSRGGADVPTYERVVATDPLALFAASNLANKLLSADPRSPHQVDPRHAYRVAMRAAQRADLAGHAYQGARALSAAVEAVHAGALGADVHCGAVRPLIEGARRRFEAARLDLPRAAWAGYVSQLQRQEEYIAGGPDHRVFARSIPQEATLHAIFRTCAGCGASKFEALKCSRCGAFYCSSACQKAHWPEHKAACKAARRGG